jgi:hypothetical protein
MFMAQGVNSVIFESERYNLIEHPMENNYMLLRYINYDKPEM